ncbi:MAG: hydrogenase large subunit, partial [Thermoprotei archaeon]
MASENNVLEKLREFGIVRKATHNAFIIDVFKNKLYELCRFLIDELEAYYSTSIGVDERPLNRSFAVYHVFVSDKMSQYFLIRLEASPSHPFVKSITPIIPGADWAEREVMDMIGVKFAGHPRPYRLILPYDWPSNIYPLRKDFDYNDKYPVKDMVDKVIHGSTDYVIDKNTLEEEYTAVPIGPYHPALHEPEYFEVYVDGEKIVDARYKGFFIHRGIEKIAETRLTYDQVPFIAERICGICGFTHSTAYCLAVENAAGIDVPERANYIRSILLEIERIHSHLLWMGVAFHLLGYDTGFMIMWRIREKIMDLAEELTGNRKTYGANIVGGIRKRFDISEEKIPHIKRLLNSVKEEYLKYIDKIVSMTEIRKRTREVGILTHEDAKKYSVLGPHARASGINTDVRKYRSYAAYGEVDFKVPVRDEGDVYARIIVRHEEVLESISIISQLLDNLPKTPLRAEFDYIPEKRIGIGCTEAPRGEDLHFVITGYGNKVYRWRPRAPSYNNLASVP